ncbi:adenylate cyclase class 2 [Keratinibaculum paraultunense]|uniref:Adenylate cyclase class 2 n=1 Tax=Keratinibaculum paraultunense TaxID=1278232 RepID=A0A4R3L227_9FIRM|nr:class IV adenylate cyclase [Keratinibaculum paraultunense]QQY78880.1 class IV adenylate cyclase [Keratinibaculum paraultunense]TCS90492.1 adenylate cyclase class 2 [Keratinibaculum paraultunense]
MAKEIEVKVLNVDLDEMEERLLKLGAKLVAKEYQINTIFDSKDKYIYNCLNGYLRIREIKDLLTDEVHINLTLKQNIGNKNTRQNIETTTEIDNKYAMISILERLRYYEIGKGSKYRTSYMYEGIRFDLDRWDENTYPYPYMEIEVEKEEDLRKAIEFLKIDRNNISTKSIVGLQQNL